MTAPARTALAPCADYQPSNVRAALVSVLDSAGGLDWVRPGMRVGVKLNLCAGRAPETATTTHPIMAAELTRLLVERGASVVLGDSPGGPYNESFLNRIYATTGMTLCEEAGGELNRDFSYSSVRFADGVSIKEFQFTDWLSKCDAVINFSKLKAHGLMGMTAAVKNLYGIIPGTIKTEYHFQHPDPADFADMLVDLNEYLRPALCICDGVDIMEGNGPTQGTPRHLGVVAASTSPYELDRLCAALTGMKESELPYLTAASRRGLLPPDDGSLASLASSFALGDFVRSGSTTSWFTSSPNDTPMRKFMKKGLSMLMRSRPQLGKGCVGCGHCANMCPAKAIKIRHGKAVIDRSACVRCFCCQEFCPKGAMKVRRTFIARLIQK